MSVCCITTLLELKKNRNCETEKIQIPLTFFEQARFLHDSSLHDPSNHDAIFLVSDRSTLNPELIRRSSVRQILQNTLLVDVQI